MKSTFLTLAAVLGLALGAAAIPVANANADTAFTGHGAALTANANQ